MDRRTFILSLSTMTLCHVTSQGANITSRRAYNNVIPVPSRVIRVVALSDIGIRQLDHIVMSGIARIDNDGYDTHRVESWAVHTDAGILERGLASERILLDANYHNWRKTVDRLVDGADLIVLLTNTEILFFNMDYSYLAEKAKEAGAITVAVITPIMWGVDLPNPYVHTYLRSPTLDSDLCNGMNAIIDLPHPHRAEVILGRSVDPTTMATPVLRWLVDIANNTGLVAVDFCNAITDADTSTFEFGIAHGARQITSNLAQALKDTYLVRYGSWNQLSTVRPTFTLVSMRHDGSIKVETVERL